MEKKYSIIYGFNNDENKWEANLVDGKGNVVDYIFATTEDELNYAIEAMKSNHDIDKVEKMDFEAKLNKEPKIEMNQGDLFFDHSDEKSMKEKADEINNHEITNEELGEELPEAEEDAETIEERNSKYIPFSTLNFVYGMSLVLIILGGIIAGAFCLSVYKDPSECFLPIVGIILGCIILWNIFVAFFGLLYDVKAIRNILEKQNKNK